MLHFQQSTNTAGRHFATLAHTMLIPSARGLGGGGGTSFLSPTRMQKEPRF